jgi:hypothetical protein
MATKVALKVKEDEEVKDEINSNKMATLSNSRLPIVNRLSSDKDMEAMDTVKEAKMETGTSTRNSRTLNATLQGEAANRARDRTSTRNNTMMTLTGSRMEVIKTVKDNEAQIEALNSRAVNTMRKVEEASNRATTNVKTINIKVATMIKQTQDSLALLLEDMANFNKVKAVEVSLPARSVEINSKVIKRPWSTLIRTMEPLLASEGTERTDLGSTEATVPRYKFLNPELLLAMVLLPVNLDSSDLQLPRCKWTLIASCRKIRLKMKCRQTTQSHRPPL